MSNNAIVGSGGLAYRGTQATRPPQTYVYPRDPTDYDREGYSLLDIWLNSVSQGVFILVSLKGTSQSKGILAKWLPLSAGTPSGLQTLTGNDSQPVLPDTNGNINILGVGPLSVNTGAPGQPNTELITIASATTTTPGVVELATSAQSIAGTSGNVITAATLQSKIGTQLANGVAVGTGTGTAIDWITGGTNGQVLIGSTGALPEFANITSHDSSVTITNGPNSVDLSVETGSSGALIHISTQVANNSSTFMVFTGFTNTYTSYLFVFNSLQTGATGSGGFGSSLFGSVSLNSGSTWLGYQTPLGGGVNNNFINGGTFNTTTMANTFPIITLPISNGLNAGVCGQLWFYNLTTTTTGMCTSTMGYPTPTVTPGVTGYGLSYSYCVFASTTIGINAVRFQFAENTGSGGNSMVSGSISMYGLIS